MSKIKKAVCIVLVFFTLCGVMVIQSNAVTTKTVTANAVESFVQKAESKNGSGRFSGIPSSGSWCGYFVAWAVKNSQLGTEIAEKGNSINVASFGACCEILDWLAEKGYGKIYICPGSQAKHNANTYYGKFTGSIAFSDGSHYYVPTSNITVDYNYKPVRGDIVLYDWIYDVDGDFDHVGIMTSATTTIEGNTSGGKVAKRDLTETAYDSNDRAQGKRGEHVCAYFHFNTTQPQTTQYQLYWPVPTKSASIGSYSSAFGPRTAPTEGASSNHRGIDIPVSSGTPVYAAYDGEVVLVSNNTPNGVRGNYVLLYHSSIGISTLYQHLTSASVKKGDKVSGGSQIAISGSTGVGTGPHLHFGVMKGKATSADDDQGSMAINPLGSNISYKSVAEKPVSDNPDDYPVPTRVLNYWNELMTGDDVCWVQAVLCKLGYTVDIDGSFGPSTEAAVMKFQKANGLEQDGSVGPATLAKLKTLWNQKKASGSFSISFSPSSLTINPNASKTVDISFLGDGIYTLSYSIANSGICSASWGNVNYTTGKTSLTINGKSPGTTNVTVNLKNKSGSVLYSKSFTVKVSSYNASINVSSDSVSLVYPTNKTKSITLSVSGIYPENGTIYTNTSPSGIIKVVGGSISEPVSITALKTGNATITFTLKSSDTQETLATKVVNVTVSPQIYTVSFNANGGSVSPTSKSVAYGNSIGTLPTPTRAGYTFDGWYTASSGGTNVSASSTVTGNMTLYAHWKTIDVRPSTSLFTSIFASIRQMFSNIFNIFNIFR